MKEKMYLLLIILGAVSLFIGMLLAMKSMKPMHFTVLAGIIVIVGTLFGIFGKLLQDQSNSNNTTNILGKSDSLQTKIDKLDLEIAERDSMLLEQSNKNVKLSELNSEMSIRLSEKALDIYDINKKIKYPLPDFVTVSYQIYFKLDEKSQEIADSLLSTLSLNSNSFDIISFELTNKLFSPVNYMSIAFSKDYKISKETYNLSNPLLLSLSANITPMNSRVTYNQDKTTFLLTIENLQLTKDIYKFDSGLNSNISSNSIFDLEGSSVILWQVLSKNCQIIQIDDLYVRSPELNLTFKRIEGTANEKVFLCSRNLEL